MAVLQVVFATPAPIPARTCEKFFSPVTRASTWSLLFVTQSVTCMAGRTNCAANAKFSVGWILFFFKAFFF